VTRARDIMPNGWSISFCGVDHPSSRN